MLGTGTMKTVIRTKNCQQYSEFGQDGRLHIHYMYVYLYMYMY